ncbi:MAG: glycosyltransferase family 4 protein, partial [Actinomycetota bacterium]|nr:glycosyltransferase family 4 protein [Actinomycetota bacterium]
MRTSDAPLGGDSRRPLRILRLAHAYDPGRTAAGAGVYASNLGRSLAERGHEFHILTCMPDGERRDYFERDVHIHVRRGLPFSRSRLGVAQSRHAEPRKLPFPWTLIHLYTALSSWVEYRRLGIRFDVIESGDLFAAGLLFALRRRSPLVVRLHT